MYLWNADYLLKKLTNCWMWNKFNWIFYNGFNFVYRHRLWSSQERRGTINAEWCKSLAVRCTRQRFHASKIRSHCTPCRCCQRLYQSHAVRDIISLKIKLSNIKYYLMNIRGSYIAYILNILNITCNARKH